MIEKEIVLRSANDVQEFVNAATVFKGNIEISCDQTVISAKSIMGVFSLDLSQNLLMQIYDSSDSDTADFLDRIDSFVI